jgi:hypothetical protein
VDGGYGLIILERRGLGSAVSADDEIGKDGCTTSDRTCESVLFGFVQAKAVAV